MSSGIAKARPNQPSNDSGTTVEGGTSRVSATPAAPSYVIDGLPPVLCVKTTCRHSEPPAGMISGNSWLALVLTVNGLAVNVPDKPYVAVQVLGAAGTVATNPAQLVVAETPALRVAVSLVLPLPPIQYIVKLQTPGDTVCGCASGLVNAKTVVTPPADDWMAQGVACVPTFWSMVGVVHAAPPWR